jgi:AbrB family looped-hinge helix DNA binding protein
METSLVTIKGQIVIPSKVRRRHNIKQGTRVCFIEQGDDIIIRPVTNKYIDGLKGILKTGGKALQALLEEKKREQNL